MLRVSGLWKQLGGRHVLQDLNCVWDRPGVLVISGDNGAGKSTLLRVIAGIVAPDSGDVAIGGALLSRDRVAALRSLGYLAEAAEVPAQLSVEELLSLVAALKHASTNIRAVAALTGATEILEQRFGTLSLGQRRRACLAAALIGEPRLLAMDEPTNGLDADGVEMLASLLRDRTRLGVSTVIATHDPAFIGRVADARMQLANGRLTDIDCSA